MRNLKKLFAVVMVVAMLASIMVPALAAESFKYEAEAKMLYDLGLFKGEKEGEYVPNLGGTLIRETGLALMMRAQGLEDEVAALTAEEVAAELAKVVDADEITEWARPYVAYAVKNGLTDGIKKEGSNIVFAPKLTLTGKEFINFMLKAMGYKDNNAVAWDDVLAKAAEVGMLSAGDAVSLGTVTTLTRDSAVGILAGSLKATTVDGKTLAQALVEAGVVDAEKLAEYGYEVEVPGAVEELAFTVTAKKVNVLEVVFNKAVDTSDVTLTVVKGNANVDISAPVWNADKTVATITTTAKMTNGVYTVKATSAADGSVVSGTVEIKSQYVAEIKLLNEVALTSNDSKNVYVYYDVVDQYGESLRTSTSIEWSFSAQKVSDNRNTGVITLKKSDDAVFNYGEKIYVTGVYTKTGVTVTGVLSVGAKQAVNGVEIVGFVKKGTTEVLNVLPSGFKEGTYYMIYKVTDQNGNPITADKPVYNNDLTFISDNVLIVKEFDKDSETVLTINGTEYNAILVKPGINVATGGEVNITAIANKTGNKVVKNIVVGEDQILTSFTLLSPAGIVADGETVEIPFEAKDQNGNDIKNFVTLAKQTAFNKLTFTTSAGKLKLSEKADGTAKLEYIDDTMDWDNQLTTDGLDRTVSLTSVVVGGTTSNLLLYVQDKARPEAIADIEMDTVLVERGETKIDLTKFTFLDQYGRKMDKKDNIDAVANGFFAAARDGKLKNNEFAGYKFVIRTTFKGDAGYFKNIGDNAKDLGPDVVTDISAAPAEDTFILAANANKVVSSKSGFSMKFEIVKYSATKEPAAISPAKNVALTIVDIKAVSGYTVGDLNKFFVQTVKSGDVTGDTGYQLNTGNINTVIAFADADAAISDAYKQEVKVTGKFAGVTVTIPDAYLTIESGKLSTAGTDSDKNAVIDAVYNGGFKWSDFYDPTSARYVRKDASDTIKVVIKDLDNANEKIDTISKTVAVSDENPKVATIDGVDAVTVSPVNTGLSIAVDSAESKIKVFGKEFKFKDQYGVELAVTPTFKVSSVVENANGYAENNFLVTGNDTSKLTIVGAERGDTFVLTIKAGDVTKTVNVTVGADETANITGNANNYLDILVDKYLEIQRINGLN